MTSRLRIAVTGLAATYPFGGVFWDYLQYPLGFRRLGHDVLYVEDTGKWCYDPLAATFVEDGATNAGILAREVAALDAGLADRWFFRDGAGRTYGRSWASVVEFCRSADLFVHVSASCWMREEYFAAARVAFIDTDPLYTQASVPAYQAGTIDDDARARVDMLRAHDVHFTFGENVGAADCRVPTGLFTWLPTRQPIVLDCFQRAAVPVDARRRTLTTVASWEPAETGPVVEGVRYGSKGVEFERFVDLPSRCAMPIELALGGRAPLERLRGHGWRLVDGYGVSRDPWIYRDFLAHSFGEFSVAKNAYVASRSGWFSCRTACYLALGVPAIVQDTGFASAIPTGDGLFAFTTADEAAAAVEALLSDPDRHAKAAQALAAEYFDSDKVLARLVRQAL
ncbi:MAG: glycosyltransferase family 1 protein [Candidatus Rokuibacteriota bacterium]